MEKVKICSDFTGYYYDEENKTLKEYERIGVTVSFGPTGSVLYRCKLAGEEQIIKDNNIRLYESVENFLNNKSVELNEYSLPQLFKAITGFNPMEKGEHVYALEWVNGALKTVCIDEYSFLYLDDDHPDGGHEFYSSVKECFQSHDFEVTANNGKKTLYRSAKTLLQLSKEQESYVRELVAMLSKAEQFGLELICCEDKLFCIPLEHVEKLDYNIGSYGEEYPDFQDCYSQVPQFSFPIGAWHMDSIDIKFKDESLKQTL